MMMMNSIGLLRLPRQGSDDRSGKPCVICQQSCLRPQIQSEVHRRDQCWAVGMQGDERRRHYRRPLPGMHRHVA
ncbi:hypothetical protein Cni_G23979 [Canna indica]|uniref:Uncharacterized protein n=1 Tax=Canna indica TaxID=4628 RepID=A0AAQ3KUG0_9LILI|nr:hypothetical protein Cni_G23979 [Canna indica]